MQQSFGTMALPPDQVNPGPPSAVSGTMSDAHSTLQACDVCLTVPQLVFALLLKKHELYTYQQVSWVSSKPNYTLVLNIINKNNKILCKSIKYIYVKFNISKTLKSMLWKGVIKMS